MPTYEYECQSCGHTFERFQNISDEPLKRCPKCRCKVKRLIGSGAGIIFKGSGFYETDYRSKSYTEAAKKEKTAGTSESSSSSTKKSPSSESTGSKASKAKADS